MRLVAKPAARPRSSWLAGVLIFVGALQAAATIGPPIKIRLTGGPVVAKAGEELRGSFDIFAGADGQLYDLALDGLGWSARLDGDTSLFLKAGETRRISFRAVPTDPTQPLRLRGNFEGGPVGRDFHLDAASFAKAQTKHRMVTSDPGGPRLGGARRSGKAQLLQFSGRVLYTRSDNTQVGVDAVRIRVMDNDGLGSEQIISFATNTNGSFDVSVNWDDCDELGCDDPDIYLVVETVSAAAILRADDEDDTLYAWHTDEIEDFQGTEIDFGNLLPADPNTEGALHIYTSLVRAARIAAIDGAMTAPTVEARWPDNQGGTFYNSLSEIHIGASETWTEGTHHHEYGHHLQKVFSSLLPTSYNNGFCDTPNPGHCVWCPENSTDAWQEGWADWYGGYVSRRYVSDFNITPVSLNDNRYDLEGTFTCGQDGQTYPDATTEGWIGALLRDIEDSTDDDHDGGGPDCDMDVLSLGKDEIFTVFREDDPTVFASFMASFRSRYPEHDTALRSTARNVATAFGFATVQPAVVAQPQACSSGRIGETVALSVTANGPLLQYQWRRNGLNLAAGGGIAQPTSSTLLIGPLTAELSGSYDCVVTSCDGTLSATSTTVRVGVGGVAPAQMVAWGENSCGQAGVGTSGANVLPQMVASIPDLIDLDGGRNAVTGIRADGSVWTWGCQGSGELGNGGTSNQVTTPAQISGISDAMRVASGWYHSLVLTGDGGVRAFGYNFSGQLGDQTFIDRWTPVSMAVPGCAIDVAAGYHTSLVLGGDGQVYACGSNDGRWLLAGMPALRVSTLTPIAGLDDCIAVAAKAVSYYALKSDGTVWAWGQNLSGQLGDGTTTSTATPVQVSGLSNIRSISCGPANGYAIDNNGVAYAWGTIGSGQIGDPSIVGAYQTTPVPIPSLASPLKIEATHGATTYALLADGSVRVWGLNQQLSYGASTPNFSFTPLPLPFLANVTGIAASWWTVFAFGQLISPTGVEDPRPAPPQRLALSARPNPFGARTQLALSLPQPGRATVRVYDLAGRLVRTVLDEPRPAGTLQTAWDGRDDAGRPTAAGIYMVRLQVGDQVISSKLLRME